MVASKNPNGLSGVLRPAGGRDAGLEHRGLLGGLIAAAGLEHQHAGPFHGQGVGGLPAGGARPDTMTSYVFLSASVLEMNDILGRHCRSAAVRSHSRKLFPRQIRCRAINPSARVHRPVSMRAHIPGRREFLQGAAAAALPFALQGCTSGGGKGEPLVGRRPAGDLQSHAARRLRGQGSQPSRQAPRRMPSRSSTASTAAGPRSRNR